MCIRDSFKAEVMELCHRENLYQIDLLHGSKNGITEREYWAHKKGQAKLDKENAALAADGKPVKPVSYTHLAGGRRRYCVQSAGKHADDGKENRKDNLQGSCPFQQYQHLSLIHI